MDWGLCGGTVNDPCLTTAESLGTFCIITVLVALFFLGSFVVLRLLWVAFHWRDSYKEDKHIAAIARATTGAMAWEKVDTTDTTTYIRQLYDNLEAERLRRLAAQGVYPHTPRGNTNDED